MPRIRYQLLIAFGIFCIITGIAVKNQLNKQEAFRQEMITIVKSQEVQDRLVEGLKSFDSGAFTEKGMIQSFTIDYDSIKHNPMGGIMFTMYVNDDKELNIKIILHKNLNTGKYSFSAVYASELDELVREKKE